MSQKISKDEVLKQVNAAFGFVPNLFKGMAEHNPSVAAAFLNANAALDGGVLTGAERQAVMLAVSAYNQCHYCTAVHRTMGKGAGVSQADLDAIDGLKVPSNARLATVVEAAWTVLRERGRVGEATRARLGIDMAELFEIIAIVGLKTISNYINHAQRTEVDEPLRGQATRLQPVATA
jgi:AhpD family alkylhydroperoxidase